MASIISGTNGITADTLTSTGTGALTLPVGTTAQRPNPAVVGQLRFNTTIGGTEMYNGALWNTLGAVYAATLLVVGGGGGGRYGVHPESGGAGAGGGAGGTIFQSIPLTKNTVYTVTVGAGGPQIVSGSNSVFGALTASGGGGNGGYAGNGTPLQGFPGGIYSLGGASGGGGAGGVGGNGSEPGYGGNGGVGISIGITGSAIYYAGGGGGGGYSSSGSGGSGGGGAGSTSGAGGAGTVNTGGGGGGGAYNSNQPGGAGGSGIVILSVSTINYSGTTTGSPTVTTNGTNTVMKFTSSGSYTA